MKINVGQIILDNFGMYKLECVYLPEYRAELIFAIWRSKQCIYTELIFAIGQNLKDFTELCFADDMPPPKRICGIKGILYEKHLVQEATPVCAIFGACALSTRYISTYIAPRVESDQI